MTNGESGSAASRPSGASLAPRPSATRPSGVTPYAELVDFLRHVGKDPSRLIFEDELTGIHNRRFLLSYFEHKVRWASGQDFPLSLLVIDLDRFKEINDTYGHSTGDQLLTWMAALLKETAGETGLPIRFGGDEFMVVLPETDRAGASAVAEQLLQRTRERPFRLRDGGMTVPVTMSVGVASAPEDAQTSRELFQAADTALYHAKQTGRDRAAVAAEIDLTKVFPRTALHRLRATGIVGREDALAAVSDALEALGRRQSRFLVFEGGPGMGKSTLLETVRHNIATDENIAVTRVVGDPQEGYRPYYLAARIVISLLNEREDGGKAVLDELTPEELAYLGEVLPHLGESQELLAEEDAAAVRQRIFAALARFVPRIVDHRPLVLIVDDLQFADEATLLMLRVLIQRDDVPMLVCGSSLESLGLLGESGPAPLERFYTAADGDLPLSRLQLRPLNEKDIGEYLGAVFPNLHMPGGFEQDLARITQGHPLFLAEIIRKLVTDHRVTLVGQQWVIEPLEEGYLPRSLEEIVQQKIAGLDAESRQILERASALGEEIPVSVLAGSADVDENKVLDFLDRAEALGLISLDFQVNDEVMHFLGKRVLEISYGEIEQARRRALHEEVGTYQEGLYRQELLPSASLLAYHFKRSANQEKATRYERVQSTYAQTVFDPQEAATYTEDLLEDVGETEERLTPNGYAQLPAVLRTFTKAARTVQLYPPESQAVAQALEQVKVTIDPILAENERLHLAQAQGVLLANGQRVDLAESNVLAETFLELLSRSELQGIVFERGFTEVEVRSLIVMTAQVRPENVGRDFWRAFANEHGLRNIVLHQRRYARVRRRRTTATVQQPVGEEEELEPEELAQIPKILRDLLSAEKTIKLYPLDSQPVGQSIQRLHGSLGAILERRDLLTFAGVDQSLLVNGSRVDTGAYDVLANNLLAFMSSVGLDSITFIKHLPLEELQTFIGVLRELPSTGADADFWDRFAQERQLTHLAFNQRQYALGIVRSLLSRVEAQTGVTVTEGEAGDGGSAAEATAAKVEALSDEPAEAVRQALPRFGRELLVKGEHGLLRRLLGQLFRDFATQDSANRERAVQACRLLFENLILGLQHQFTELVVEPLLAALSDEQEGRVLRELGAVLSGMANSAVQFADHSLASRILLELRARRQQLEGRGGKNAEALAALLDRKLDLAVQQLLENDFISGDPDRQERAAQVLESLGAPAIPLLVSVIKQESDFRTRKLAASLLAEQGPDAGRQIKRAVVTEVIVEQRSRVLEVIDTVTTDLKDELGYALRDRNPKIRRAAFRLFERLRRDDLIEFVLPMAYDDDPGAARGAVRSLAQLGTPAACKALVRILDDAKDPKLALACCQALGELADADAADTLARVLGDRKLPFFRRRWSDEVRANAAMALKQIRDPRATAALARFAKDGDPRVRQLGRSAQSA